MICGIDDKLKQKSAASPCKTQQGGVTDITCHIAHEEPHGMRKMMVLGVAWHALDIAAVWEHAVEH